MSLFGNWIPRRQKGSAKDIELLRNLLLQMNFDDIQVEVDSEIRGAFHHYYSGKGDQNEAAYVFSLIFSFDLHQGFGNRMQSGKIEDVYFTHKAFRGKDTLKIGFFLSESRIGLLGMRKNSYSTYRITIRGKILEDKLRNISAALPELQTPIQEAVEYYKTQCFKNQMLPHFSKVHTFADTIQQAYVLAMVSNTPQQAYKAALMTFYGHLFDDFVDQLPNIAEIVGDINSLAARLRQALPPEPKRCMDWFLNLGEDEYTKQGIFESLMAVICGALIQQSKSEKDQKQYADFYRNYFLRWIAVLPLGKELGEKLHPMQICLSVHSTLHSFFALEHDVDGRVLAPLYSLYYAPMLYCHDKEEEASKGGEDFVVYYGKELCEGKFLSDAKLIELVDIFDRWVHTFPDARKPARYKQMTYVFKTFEPVLSAHLKERYKQSLARFGLTLQKKQ